MESRRWRQATAPVDITAGPLHTLTTLTDTADVGVGVRKIEMEDVHKEDVSRWKKGHQKRREKKKEWMKERKSKTEEKKKEKQHRSE